MVEEKVCLTATQLDNITKARAAELGADVSDVCPKAKRFVRGFFGDKKKKKQKKEMNEEHIIEGGITAWIEKKIEGWI